MGNIRGRHRANCSLSLGQSLWCGSNVEPPCAYSLLKSFNSSCLLFHRHLLMAPILPVYFSTEVGPASQTLARRLPGISQITGSNHCADRVVVPSRRLILPCSSSRPTGSHFCFSWARPFYTREITDVKTSSFFVIQHNWTFFSFLLIWHCAYPVPTYTWVRLPHSRRSQIDRRPTLRAAFGRKFATVNKLNKRNPETLLALIQLS